MDDVLPLQPHARGGHASIHRLYPAISTLQGRAGITVVVEEFGDRVVEDAVPGPVDGDPMAGDPGDLIIVNEATWRAG